MEASLVYLSGQWLPHSQLNIASDDLGFLQGVTAVERLRTWHGGLPLLAKHLRRFQQSTAALEIAGLPNEAELASLLHELLQRNSPQVDVGITLFATPGRRGGNQPTLALHCTALEERRIESLRVRGQPLIITAVQQPDPLCWPRTIKVRARVHYHLADSWARRATPDALGVLLDNDGSVTETSTSNIIVRERNRLILPPQDRVLPGIMAETVCEIAETFGLHVERKPIRPEMLLDENSVWLTSSEVGLWWACSVDGVAKQPGPDFQHFQELLITHLTSSAT